MSDLKTLTLQTLLANRGRIHELTLIGYEAIEDDAARELPFLLGTFRESGFEIDPEKPVPPQWLFLQGLRSLSDTSAEGLSRHFGFLGLSGLRVLTANAAGAFSSHQGTLHLCGITSLPDADIEQLSDHRGYLGLGGLTSLTEAAATSLARHLDVLDLSGLVELPDLLAKSLSAHCGTLHLYGLRTLSDKAVSALFRVKGDLYFSKTIDVSVAGKDLFFKRHGVYGLDRR